jgi:hypothetical protein
VIVAALLAYWEEIHRQVVTVIALAEPVIATSPVLGVVFVLLAALSAMLVFFSGLLLVPYDMQTRSVLQTDQRDTALTSNSGTVESNPDGSVDIYFGPKAPAGKESNWVQTMPGKSWSALLRLYGPLEPRFDKSWKPGEFELVNEEPTT